MVVSGVISPLIWLISIGTLLIIPIFNYPRTSKYSFGFLVGLS